MLLLLSSRSFCVGNDKSELLERESRRYEGCGKGRGGSVSREGVGHTEAAAAAGAAGTLTLCFCSRRTGPDSIGSLSGHARTAAAHPTSSGSVENEGLLGRDRRRMPLAQVPPLLVEALVLAAAAAAASLLASCTLDAGTLHDPSTERHRAHSTVAGITASASSAPLASLSSSRATSPRSRGQRREGAAAGAARLRGWPLAGCRSHPPMQRRCAHPRGKPTGQTTPSSAQKAGDGHAAAHEEREHRHRQLLLLLLLPAAMRGRPDTCCTRGAVPRRSVGPTPPQHRPSPHAAFAPGGQSRGAAGAGEQTCGPRRAARTRTQARRARGKEGSLLGRQVRRDALQLRGGRVGQLVEDLHGAATGVVAAGHGQARSPGGGEGHGGGVARRDAAVSSGEVRHTRTGHTEGSGWQCGGSGMQRWYKLILRDTTSVKHLFC